MSIEEIVSTFKQLPLDASLYLILALSSCSGVFSDNGRIAFLVQNKEDLPFECIETEYLSLKTNVRIHAVQNTQTFKDDYYNVIAFKGTIDDVNLEAFLKLCIVYSNNLGELRFKEFFYSLISLFQLPAEQQSKNALGLFGELKFMQYIWATFEKDISPHWHKSGSLSKYDFTLNRINFEVKSSLSTEMVVAIKHAQIFNEHVCYLIVVRCEKCDDGETIEDLISQFADIPNAFKNLNYSVNLQKELKRISAVDANTLRLNIIGIDVFDAAEVNPFEELPCNIAHLTYKLDLVDKPTVSEEQLDTVLLKGC